jgi:predicted metal-binding membrane protein
MSTNTSQIIVNQISRRAASLAVYGLAVIAWVALAVLTPPGLGDDSHTSHTHAGHSPPNMGIVDPGVPETMAIAQGVSGVTSYLVMWWLMVAAMMYPSSARIFQTYADVLQPRGGRITGVSVAIIIYTSVWIMIGIIPLAVAAFIQIFPVTAGDGLGLMGGAFVLLSAYQISPYKQHCLKRCRSPETMLSSDSPSGIGSAVRFSATFSRDDIGSCWVWMGFMVAVGSMNLLWMAVISILLTFEQLGPNGDDFAKIIGIVLLLLGLGMVAVHVF